MSIARYKLWILSLVLIAVGASWRIVNHHYGLAPNLEIVTTASLLAAAYLARRSAMIVPLAIMAVSDAFIGNTAILLFTWSGFAAIGAAGLLLRRWRKRPARLVLGSLGLAAVGSVWFFLWTNFGVWIMGTMYPHTWAGLLECYMMGLPFYRTMLAGNLLLVPAAFSIASITLRVGSKWRNAQAARIIRI